MHDPILPALLQRLHNIPALIVWGKEDRIVPLESAGIYHRMIAGAKLELIERCGHLPHLERPTEFLRIVNAFLAE